MLFLLEKKTQGDFATLTRAFRKEIEGPVPSVPVILDYSRALSACLQDILFVEARRDRLFRGARSLPQDPPSTSYFTDDTSNVTSNLIALSVKLLEALRRKDGAVHFVEAGCGVGAYALFAAAFDPRVQVYACDISSEEIAAAKRLFGACTYNSQVTLEERDLLASPYSGPVDVLFSEHVSRGGMEELTTQIPRSVKNADPNMTIPWAVTPSFLCDTPVIRERYIFDGEYCFAFPTTVNAIQGDRVVINDPHSDGLARLQVRRDWVPGLSPLHAGVDIEMVDPLTRAKLDLTLSSRLVRSSSKFAVSMNSDLLPNDDRDHFLLGYVPFVATHGGLCENRYIGIFNPDKSATSAAVEIVYPFGYSGTNHNRNPNFVVNPPSISVRSDGNKVFACTFKTEGYGDQTVATDVQPYKPRLF